MYNIVIAIPTYKRPNMLNNLVRHIFTSTINDQWIGKVSIVIVDNDREKTAQAMADTLKPDCPDHIQFEYHSFSKKGLSNVRNELLRLVIAKNPDYIACIDDDEYPEPQWLLELVKTAVNNKADIVHGPVIPVFEKPTSSDISFYFQRQRHADQKRLASMSGTGNIIFKAFFLQQHQLKFDVRFNTTGGEDTYFGVQAVKKGARIFWADNAVIHETIPKQKANLNWIFKRKYRAAITYTYILILEKRYGAIIKKVAISMLYLVLGILTFPLLLFPNSYKYYGLIKFVEGLGGFAALFNLKYHEYGTNQ